MKKSLFLILSLLLLVFVPQTQAITLGETDLKASITHQLQRLYLKLPGSKPGKLVLEQALLQLPQLRTAELLAQVEVDTFNSLAEKQSSMTFVLQGPIQFGDIFNPGSYNHKFKADIKLELADTVISTNLDLLKYQQIAYIKLNQVPAIPSLNLKSVKDIWLEVPLDRLNQNSAQELTPTNRQQLSAAIQQLFAQAEVSRAERQLVGDTPVFAISVLLPNQALQTYLAATANQSEWLKQKIDQLDQIELEILVDANDYQIRRVIIPLKVEGEQVQMFSTSELDTVGAFTDAAYAEIQLLFELSNFNQQLFFELPTPTTKLEDGLLQVIQPLESDQITPKRPAELSVLSPSDKARLMTVDNSRVQ